jgi:hypothetical protein
MTRKVGRWILAAALAVGLPAALWAAENVSTMGCCPGCPLC